MRLKQLLDGWHSARAQEIDIKALLQNAVLDILTALDMPEWPVSSVILQSLCAQLLSSLGMNSSETKLRELALEILGQITAKLTEDAVACDNDDLLRVRDLVVNYSEAGEGPPALQVWVWWWCVWCGCCAYK